MMTMSDYNEDDDGESQKNSGKYYDQIIYRLDYIDGPRSRSDEPQSSSYLLKLPPNKQASC